MSTPFILVVDDEPGIARLCERLLEKAGFQALSFTEPRKALTYLQEHEIDLLLVDIRMPEIDGFSLVNFAKEYQPDIATLIMTGFGTVETAIKALRQGVDGLILKPFEKGDELVDAAHQALEDKQRKRDAAHMQALRPLFDVTETFLAETRPEMLPSLIVDAVCKHLRCENAAYYQHQDEGWQLLFKRGQAPHTSDNAAFETFISSLKSPVLLQENIATNESVQTELNSLGLGTGLWVPSTKAPIKAVVFAGRKNAGDAFREVDIDTLVILTRQAVVAVENAYLYEELRAYVKQVEDSQKALLQAEKMAAAGRLTASIAHEINNPLQAVRNCLHLAGREDLPEQKQDEYFSLAETELERLTTTVQRMLDFYRPGKVTPKDVDIDEILGHVLNLMGSQLQKREILVETNLPKELPKVLAVGAQVQQVFLNLILNAYDAMPGGGKLEISAEQIENDLAITFQDNGMGISPENQENIFEPFISTKEGGTGLGLTVSYNIIAALGGELSLVANEKPGACFQVSLPIGGK
jgi:signal transduction histidine kinase/FixJ family two-component response regulator